MTHGCDGSQAVNVSDAIRCIGGRNSDNANSDPLDTSNDDSRVTLSILIVLNKILLYRLPLSDNLPSKNNDFELFTQDSIESMAKLHGWPESFQPEIIQTKLVGALH